MSEPPAVSVILPTFNERGSLPRLIPEIHAALAGIPHEILVVDDNSPDETWRWVLEAMPMDPALRLVHRRADPGLGAAVLEGFREAHAQRWIVMDADGQHDPALLPAIVRELEDHDLVVGSRYIAGGSTGRWSLGRWIGSRGATLLAQLLLNVSLSDPMSGYFGIRRDVFEPVAAGVNPRGFKILLEVYARLSRQGAPASLRCCEVPLTFRSRLAGESKVTGRIAWQYVQQLIALRRGQPWPQGLPKFLCVGAVGVVVNCAILTMLVAAGWHYLLASLVAIQISIANNFIWHDQWTFRDRRAHSHWVRRFRDYEVTSMAGMAVNWLILAVLVGWLRMSLLPANVVGISVGTGLNFTMCKLWAWKRRPATSEI